MSTGLLSCSPNRLPPGCTAVKRFAVDSARPRQAERVGGVRLLCRDHPAARPLIAAVVAGERHRADHAVAIDDRAPHVEVESAVRLIPRRDERRFQQLP